VADGDARDLVIDGAAWRTSCPLSRVVTMTFSARIGRPVLAVGLAVVLGTSAVGVVACASGGTKLPGGTVEPDKFLFDRGTEALNTRRFIRALQYFQQLYDGYPQSPYRPDSKLGIGDAYLGENNPESLVLAANEFKEFLTFFPNHPRADYAQYKLALSHSAQMLRPDRDQKETKETIKELDTFLTRFPSSALAPDGRKKLRQARDRLSTSDYLVGLNYYRWRVYPGAIQRFKAILKDDPDYTNRDAVYYYLAESLMAVNLKAEALPYFEKLLEEFQQSEFLVKTQARVKELKG
jgi:outer membrane protein assembly factor BamD